jgi:hypothetical protein
VEYFNGNYWKQNYPEVKERLKASCPQEFQGKKQAYTMRAAMKFRFDYIAGVIRLLEESKEGFDPFEVGLDWRLCQEVNAIFCAF